MRFSTSLFALAAVPLLVSALPVKRTSSNADNILVFQFADVLNHLENEFYTQALAKFQESDFASAGFSNSQVAIQLFQGIASDESNHFNFLESSITELGGSQVSGCSFDFSSVLTDVQTMLSVARIVENVGVAAFLGGATLLTDTVVLDSAATILTIEARHQTILNVLNLGSAIPQSFDMAFTPSEVLAIAGGFISGCDLGIPANPSLTITNTGIITAGTQLSFSSQAVNGSTDGLFCQMMVGGQPASIPLPFNQCVVPQGIDGPVAVFITSDGQPLINNVIDRATAQLVAGPVVTFVDAQPQMLGQLARPNASGNSGSSNSVAQNCPTPGCSSPSTTVSSPDASASATAPAASSTSPPSSSSSSSSSSPPAAPDGNQSPPSADTPPQGVNTTKGPVDGGAVTVNGWITVDSIPQVSGSG